MNSIDIKAICLYPAVLLLSPFLLYLKMPPRVPGLQLLPSRINFIHTLDQIFQKTNNDFDRDVVYFTDFIALLWLVSENSKKFGSELYVLEGSTKAVVSNKGNPKIPF